MNKNSKVAIVIVALIVIIGVGYAVLHKSNKTNATVAVSNTSSITPAATDSVVITKTSSTLGQYLAEPNGQALYTYDMDTSGTSNCTGSCLSTWPAYQDKGSTTNLPKDVGVIKRPDNGQTQYTYNGKPLYAFASDQVGQATGNGVASFSIAKTSSASPSATSTTSSGSASQTSSSNGSTSSSNW
jgi:predicted lipoprotein with Yx(FWY)xxD motif